MANCELCNVDSLVRIKNKEGKIICVQCAFDSLVDNKSKGSYEWQSSDEKKEKSKKKSK
jgi:hypothetical protein